MGGVEVLDALRCGEKAEEADVLCAALLELLDAAIEELPVASMGSTTMIKRSDRASGALK